mmetsp:Transcript_113027/g.326622  ORF Transcript_113027/g.326622 Transcript_113027/m.326622 type:complete len:204 (+) Transcript_113027:764-1375(+)
MCCRCILLLKISRKLSSSRSLRSILSNISNASRMRDPRMSSRKLQIRRRADSNSMQRLTAARRVNRRRSCRVCVSATISARSLKLVGMFCSIHMGPPPPLGMRTRSYLNAARLDVGKEECPCWESTFRTRSAPCNNWRKGFDPAKRLGMSAATSVRTFMHSTSSGNVARNASNWPRKHPCGTPATAHTNASADESPSTPWRST